MPTQLLIQLFFEVQKKNKNSSGIQLLNLQLLSKVISQ